MDTAILILIPGVDPDLTTYLNPLLRRSKREQQSNTFWFPTPKNPGITENHTPMQTRILNELNELKNEEKLNPADKAESSGKFFERFDWTDRLLNELEKKAFENILVKYMIFFLDTEWTSG